MIDTEESDFHLGKLIRQELDRQKRPVTKRKELIEFAQTRKEKSYYLTIVDCFVRTNSIMSKEYKKNGWCFIDPDFSSEKFVEAANQGKIDFFDAYLVVIIMQFCNLKKEMSKSKPFKDFGKEFYHYVSQRG